MWKALVAGLFVLAFAGAPAKAEMNPQLEAGIARFKAALRLKPEQQKHWPRVEAALRSIANDGDKVEVADAQPGFIRRTVNRASELAMNASSVRRLVSAAQPLVKTLDEDQKREALTLARSMGFGQLAARFE
jgi:zinc resistance-associated protein